MLRMLHYLKGEIMKFKEPIDLIAGDQPNTCPFDGARTELLETRDEFSIERCILCDRRFNFWSDDNDL